MTDHLGTRIHRMRACCALLACLAAAVVHGCGSSAGPTERAAAKPGTSPAPSASNAGDTHARSAARETWDVLFLQGERIGYARTTETPERQDDQDVTRVDVECRMTMERFAQAIEINVLAKSFETAGGALLAFECEEQLGGLPKITRGQVDGDQLLLESIVAGQSSKSTVAWPRGAGGINASQRSLCNEPLASGQHRQVLEFSPTLNQVATIEMTARDIEPVQLLTETRRLLRVDAVTSIEGAPAMTSTLWVDEQGEILRADQTGGMTSFRTTREVALAEAAAPRMDIGLASKVAIDRPLADAHTTRQVRYLVTIEDDDPSRMFPNGATQKVRRTSEHEAEIVVSSLRRKPGELTGPATAPNQAAAERVPAPEDRAANEYIQTGDPLVAALAAEGAVAGETPWETALRLEQTVYRSIENKNFSRAFASAAETAQSREGDCTEHAVLLAAMARVAKIPSRVAVGLVYMEPDAAFGYHMWTEVFVDGRWTAIDGTLGRGGIGAAHIKVADTNLDGVSPYVSFLTITELLGRLKIRVVDAEY